MTDQPGADRPGDQPGDRPGDASSTGEGMDRPTDPPNDAGLSMFLDPTADPDAWIEQMRRWVEEDLHPDLVPYLDDGGAMGMPMLRHPLVYQVPFSVPGQANAIYASKRHRLASALAEADWETVVWLHERPYRTEALIRYVVGVDAHGRPRPLAQAAPQVQDLAADVWVDSENLGQASREWDALLAGATGLVLGDEEERAAFAALPDPVVVYRADIEDAGYSWSTDRRVAEFFAHRFGESHRLVTGQVAKADVIGYLLRRGEFEVLVPEGRVTGVRAVD